MTDNEQIATVEDDPGWHKGTPIDNPEDGFRPRRETRPAGWLEAAIADGSVRAPDAPHPDEGKEYPGAVVIRPPVATISGDGT